MNYVRSFSGNISYNSYGIHDNEVNIYFNNFIENDRSNFSFTIRRRQSSSSTYGYAYMTRLTNGTSQRIGIGDAWSSTQYAINPNWSTCSISSGASACDLRSSYNITHTFNDSLSNTDLNTLSIRMRSDYQDGIQEIKFTSK